MAVFAETHEDWSNVSFSCLLRFIHLYFCNCVTPISSFACTCKILIMIQSMLSVNKEICYINAAQRFIPAGKIAKLEALIAAVLPENGRLIWKLAQPKRGGAWKTWTKVVWYGRCKRVKPWQSSKLSSWRVQRVSLKPVLAPLASRFCSETEICSCRLLI